MAGMREIEGIGYLDYTHGGEYLLVDQWLKRPDDLKGQALTVLKILPPECRGNSANNTGGNGPVNSPRFRFRISVEVERAGGKPPA